MQHEGFVAKSPIPKQASFSRVARLPCHGVAKVLMPSRRPSQRLDLRRFGFLECRAGVEGLGMEGLNRKLMASGYEPSICRSPDLPACARSFVLLASLGGPTCRRLPVPEWNPAWMMQEPQQVAPTTQRKPLKGYAVLVVIRTILADKCTSNKSKQRSRITSSNTSKGCDVQDPSEVF